MKLNHLQRIIFYSTIVVLFAVSACKKDEEPAPTKTELLSREWKIASINDSSVELQTVVDEVTIKFNPNGNCIITGTVGGVSNPETGSWNWTNNEEILKVNINQDQMNWELKKLTSTEFWFFDTKQQYNFKCVPK